MLGTLIKKAVNIKIFFNSRTDIRFESSAKINSCLTQRKNLHNTETRLHRKDELSFYALLVGFQDFHRATAKTLNCHKVRCELDSA